MESSASGAKGLSGEVIGGYRLEGEIGARGDTTIYRGRRTSSDSALPDVAAVQVLSLPAGLDLRQERALQEQFQRRMEAVRRLRDPHITPVLAWGDDESQPYVLLRFVVLPYLDSQTLASRLARGPLGLNEAAGLAAQVAEGLDFAHAARVIHGAVTPAHILLDGEGTASLTGFAIDVAPEALAPVRARAAPPGDTPAAAPFGMPDAAFTAGRAADIRGLAGVLYAMVTGRSPSVSAGSGQRAGTHGPAPLAPPRALRPELPSPAEAAIVRGMAVESGPPFASAVELTTAFAAGLGPGYQEARPVFGVLDTATLELQPTAPIMAVAPERPTAPLMTVPPATGQLIWGRRPRPRWFVVALLAVVVLFVLVLALVLGAGGAHQGGSPTRAPGVGATQGVTSSHSTLAPTNSPATTP